MLVVVALRKLVGDIVLGAGRVQRIADGARPRMCRAVTLDLRHLDGTVQELLWHAAERECIHGGLVHWNLGEDGVDPGTLRSEGLVSFALHGEELTLAQVVSVLAENHNEIVLQMRGGRW